MNNSTIIISLLQEAIQLLREIRDSKSSVKRHDPSVVFAKEYLTEEEACVYLDCSKAYIRSLMKFDKNNGPAISFFQPSSNNRYISRHELDRWITRVRIRSGEEINSIVK